MIEINATIVLQVINFLALVYILNRLLVKPVMKTINSRREYVEGKYSRVEEL
ncbi:MAG TPA: ATP synthase F0 subunit B, partial [Deltaproteobacteria bacterium]|nr:ATP synthase F0 subunit B [Deltaproteobacteria bacterium]